MESNFIKRLYIRGYKKFNEVTIEFNTHMNIFVGENEAGKTTILDAIKIVFNQQYRNMDKAALIELFNIQNVEKFYSEPCIENLPRERKIEPTLQPRGAQHKLKYNSF